MTSKQSEKKGVPRNRERLLEEVFEQALQNDMKFFG